MLRRNRLGCCRGDDEVEGKRWSKGGSRRGSVGEHGICDGGRGGEKSILSDPVLHNLVD